ncbi:hypothetical protein MJM04_32600, partial [Salmonella enterica subsp. enterica serovar Cerro]|nr:hypothetical protein [Salmonella enterica subsp. enterica serovar Cerro]
ARANQHLERAAELAGNDTIPVEITRVRLQLARNENHAARHGVLEAWAIGVKGRVVKSKAQSVIEILFIRATEQSSVKGRRFMPA